MIDDQLKDIGDGCGCIEIAELLSEIRSDEDS